MVLIIEGQTIEKGPDTVSALEQTFPVLAARSRALRAAEIVTPSASNLLYVQQREFAVVAPSDDKIDVIGSDDATTCHLLVLRHTGSGVTSLAHFDGCGMEDALARMILKIHRLSHGAPEGGRLEAHVVGGFIDDRGESVKLFDELFRLFRLTPHEIHLVTCCAVEANDVVGPDSIHFPVIYGLGVDCKTGALFPATFPDRGPDDALRGARHFSGTSRKRVIDVYDGRRQCLVVEPFDMEPWEDAGWWLVQPDHQIRRCLSTSPRQEPEHFVAHIRRVLTFTVQNPSTLETFFPRGQAREYAKLPDGRWERMNEEETVVCMERGEEAPIGRREK